MCLHFLFLLSLLCSVNSVSCITLLLALVGKQRFIKYTALHTNAAPTAVGLFRLPVRRSGTRYQTNSQIRRVVLIVLGSFLRQSFLAFTRVTNALEVFKRHALYKTTFYLLTYLLTSDQHCLKKLKFKKKSKARSW